MMTCCDFFSMKRKVPTGRGSVEQVSHHARAPRYAALRAMASSRGAELAEAFPMMFSTDSGATPKKKATDFRGAGV